MKKSIIVSLTAFLVLAASAARNSYSAPQRFDGVVSDSMCGKTHMIPGKSDAQCVQECIKAGSKYVLVAGSKVYTLNAKAQTLAPFAGMYVKVQGDLKGSEIGVQTIHESTAK